MIAYGGPLDGQDVTSHGVTMIAWYGFGQQVRYQRHTLARVPWRASYVEEVAIWVADGAEPPTIAQAFADATTIRRIPFPSETK